jgi:serine phosphatase RsbU (regulator of sigma subunit)
VALARGAAGLSEYAARVREGRAASSPTASATEPSDSSERRLARVARRPRAAAPAPIIALIAGLLVTAALAIASLALYESNEDRLIKLRARELSLVLAETVPTVQTPLASAAALADATHGSASGFRAFIAPYVGPGRQFVSASLWRVGSPRAVQLARIGAPSLLASRPQALESFLSRAERPGVLELTGILEPAHPEIGFEFRASRGAPVYVVYAENSLPANRRSKIESNSAFSDLDYALYLGRSQRTSRLLATNVGSLPLRGRHATSVVPYGAGVFTLVVGPRGSLGGAFFLNLPWIVGLAGVLLSIAAALTAQRLARGRQRAEQLARDLDEIAAGDRERYREQRSIAQTLQQALLPTELPELAGLQISALYVPASAGLEVGGDWYDVVESGPGRVLLIIGDVSGHGLEAATTMALLRHAALAYAANDARPASVLENLAHFARTRGGESCFATVLCAQIGLTDGELRIASAGHLAPLLLNGDHADFVALETDPAIGLRRVRPEYHEAVAPVPPSATLIAFTDGLVERRGEVIDAGLDRLRSLAAGAHQPLGDLLATLARELTHGERRDDTAIVGVSWRR